MTEFTHVTNFGRILFLNVYFRFQLKKSIVIPRAPQSCRQDDRRRRDESCCAVCQRVFVPSATRALSRSLCFLFQTAGVLISAELGRQNVAAKPVSCLPTSEF